MMLCNVALLVYRWSAIITAEIIRLMRCRTCVVRQRRVSRYLALVMQPVV